MATILITGANRGIGLEHTRQALATGDTVIATCRHPESAAELADLADKYGDNLRIEEFDVTSGESACALVGRLDGTPIDVLINNAGYQGPGTWNVEANFQALGSIDYDIWRDILEINLLGAMRATEALKDNVAASDRKVIIMMSSDLASIGRNTIGTTHSYRTSKAALNMLAKGLAVDLEKEGVTVVALSPGWTQTDMGGPKAIWTVEESVTNQRKVIAGLGLEDSGKFYNLQGEELPW
ncbi:SDR family oxidoreductase [Altererythrobacter sp. GH1-8]|uniref:SDR family oxidoreductase n=1 Tax=Altererythrobacter sp. GH1-8 TaxID=3349333 RepID=UPI00374D1D30